MIGCAGETARRGESLYPKIAGPIIPDTRGRQAFAQATISITPGPSAPDFEPTEQTIASNPYKLAAAPADHPGAMPTSIARYTLLNAMAKWPGTSYPAARITPFRYALARMPGRGITRMRGGPGIPRTRYKALHLRRSLLGIGRIIPTGLHTLQRELAQGGGAPR